MIINCNGAVINDYGDVNIATFTEDENAYAGPYIWIREDKFGIFGGN